VSLEINIVLMKNLLYLVA